MTFEEALDFVSVHAPGMWENDVGPKDWYAVSHEKAGGIIAYFAEEEDACRFRLAEINRLLNG